MFAIPTTKKMTYHGLSGLMEAIYTSFECAMSPKKLLVLSGAQNKKGSAIGQDSAQAALPLSPQLE